MYLRVLDTTTTTYLCSYFSLLERCGHLLYGLRSGFTADQTADIEYCITDGLRTVYAAHPWSFLEPVKEMTTTAPYSTGTITVASGVVTLSVAGTFPSWAADGVLKASNEYYDVDTRDGDNQITLEDTSVTVAAGTSYELGRPEYDLPTGFEEIVGRELTYEPGQSDFYPAVEERLDEQIMRYQQDDPYHDRPIYFSTRAAQFVATTGSRRKLILYPTPDAAYILKVPMRLRSTMCDETNLYPIGGESLSQVILEAVLSAAERNFNLPTREHTDMFNALLPLAIGADYEMTSPTTLGPDAPKGPNSDVVPRSVRVGAITLDGTTM
jgi:hypothetical protein